MRFDVDIAARPNLHKSRRAIKPDDSDAESRLDSVDQRLQQKMGELRTDVCPVRRVVQFPSGAHDAQDNASSRGWAGTRNLVDGAVAAGIGESARRATMPENTKTERTHHSGFWYAILVLIGLFVAYPVSAFPICIAAIYLESWGVISKGGTTERVLEAIYAPVGRVVDGSPTAERVFRSAGKQFEAVPAPRR
jgi:hypothetical protein